MPLIQGWLWLDSAHLPRARLMLKGRGLAHKPMSSRFFFLKCWLFRFHFFTSPRAERAPRLMNFRFVGFFLRSVRPWATKASSARLLSRPARLIRFMLELELPTSHRFTSQAIDSTSCSARLPSLHLPSHCPYIKVPSQIGVRKCENLYWYFSIWIFTKLNTCIKK